MKWLAFLTVILTTGGRLAEITGLRWEDVSLETGMLAVQHPAPADREAG